MSNHTNFQNGRIEQNIRIDKIKGSSYQKLGFATPWGIAIPKGEFALFRMVLKGKCFIKLDNDDITELNEGDLILVPHSSAHWIADKANCEKVSSMEFAKSIHDGKHLFSGEQENNVMISGHFEFDTKCVHPFIKSLPNLIHIKGLQIKEMVWLEQTTDLIIEETNNEKMGSKILVGRLSEVLFIHTIRAYVEQTKNIGGFLSALKDERISKALKLIHDAPEKDWTLELLSQNAGMSRTLFCNRFKELVGETPLNYLTNWRILKAKQILETSKENIIEVANQVGYQSEASFNRIFKSKINQTPASYRRGIARLL